MSTTYQRTITNELHSLETLMNGITNFLEDNGVDAQTVYRINLAMEEFITNIIKYGYADYDSHNIQVAIEVLPGEVVAVVEDFGRAFNPLEQESKVPEESLEKQEVGGLGLHLIKKMLDGIDYRREGNKNILEIRKSRQLPGAAE